MFHFQTGLKDHHFAGRDRNTLAGTRIAAEACAAFLDLKHAEVAQLDFFTAHKAVDDDIKRFLNNLFDVNLFNARHIRDA